MIPEKQWCNTICYSAGPANDLNEKALRIDCRLFLFSCYTPKPYSESESYFSNFRTAIVNLYGLIKDCGLYTWNVIRDTGKNDSIIWRDYPHIRKVYNILWDAVSSFRSLFCHNCSHELCLDEECYTIAEGTISQVLLDDYSIEEMTENNWKNMIMKIVELAQEFVDGISFNLDIIVSTPDIKRKTKVINRWVDQIANEYTKNPAYLLHTMAVLYQKWKDNGGDTSDLNCRLKLRDQTTIWLDRYCNIESKSRWQTKWLDQSRVLQLINCWPEKWAQWYGRDKEECDEAPGIDSVFFRFLVEDVDRFANQPSKGYIETNQVAL